MEGTRIKKMTRGVVLFAFNSPSFDYYSMAVYAAKRINHYLKLPVTVITDNQSISNDSYKFDHTIIIEPDRNNKRDWGIWINKGRYKAYELSPYDETLLLDSDYIVNSDKLLKTFDMSSDFCCHDHTEFLLNPGLPQEMLSPHSFNTLWATVIMFKKTTKSKQLFECLEMVQNNFEHYANLHGFISSTFRNDYALTIALRLVNGHVIPPDNIIPWSLIHVGNRTTFTRTSDDEVSSEFLLTQENIIKGRVKTEYLIIRDMDFHAMPKHDFMIFDLFSELDKKCDRGYPLFWVVKDKNIVITRGKIGTRTLLNICDYSSNDSSLTSEKLIDMIVNQSYKLHFVIREPFERFRSGILEDWEESMRYSVDEINKVSDDSWNNVVDEFVKVTLKERNRYKNARQFHTGNWLSDIETIVQKIPTVDYKIWNVNSLNDLLSELKCDNYDLNNTKDKRSYSTKFLNAFDNLPGSTVALIDQFLLNEKLIYEKLQTS